MPCNCVSISSLCIYASPCAVSINTGLVADATGAWIFRFEFNGTWVTFGLNLTDGDIIVMPNKFNSNYTHKLEIYRPDKSLYEDTCYSMRVFLNQGAETGGTVPTIGGNEVISKEFIIIDGADGSNPLILPIGNTITIPEVIGNKLLIPEFLNYAPVTVPYDASTGTFDNTANGGFLNNDTFIISYEKAL